MATINDVIAQHPDGWPDDDCKYCFIYKGVLKFDDYELDILKQSKINTTDDLYIYSRDMYEKRRAEIAESIRVTATMAQIQMQPRPTWLVCGGCGFKMANELTNQIKGLMFDRQHKPLCPYCLAEALKTIGVPVMESKQI